MSGREEFTPDTEQVREMYAETQTGGEYGYLDNGEQGAADFDWWLAAHDAEVKAAALREAAAEVLRLDRIGKTPRDEITNAEAEGLVTSRLFQPARSIERTDLAGWLLDRADALDRPEANDGAGDPGEGPFRAAGGHMGDDEEGRG